MIEGLVIWEAYGFEGRGDLPIAPHTGQDRRCDVREGACGSRVQEVTGVGITRGGGLGGLQLFCC